MPSILGSSRVRRLRGDSCALERADADSRAPIVRRYGGCAVWAPRAIATALLALELCSRLPPTAPPTQCNHVRRAWRLFVDCPQTTPSPDETNCSGVEDASRVPRTLASRLRHAPRVRRRSVSLRTSHSLVDWQMAMLVRRSPSQLLRREGRGNGRNPCWAPSQVTTHSHVFYRRASRPSGSLLTASSARTAPMHLLFAVMDGKRRTEMPFDGLGSRRR